MLKEALEKLDPKTAVGQKEKVMAKAVADALQDFCKQDAEFAQAVAQGGSFKECMHKVAAWISSSISDIDAYKRAVQYYFPGAEIRVQMRIDLIGGAAEKPQQEQKGLLLNLEDYL